MSVTLNYVTQVMKRLSPPMFQRLLVDILCARSIHKTALIGKLNHISLDISDEFRYFLFLARNVESLY